MGDHDFTKFSMTPSVSFLIDIPETPFIQEEYDFAGLKENAFQKSSPIRHATELEGILLLVQYFCFIPMVAQITDLRLCLSKYP